MNRLQQTFMWNIISKIIGCDKYIENISNLLAKKGFNKRDFAVIMYSKMARYHSDTLQNKVNEAITEWVKELHWEAFKMYEEFPSADKEEVDAIIKQLEELHSGIKSTEKKVDYKDIADEIQNKNTELLHCKNEMDRLISEQLNLILKLKSREEKRE